MNIHATTCGVLIFSLLCCTSCTNTMGDPDDQKVTMLFGGDVMFSRYVGRQMQIKDTFADQLQYVADDFRNADVAFVNLESPFSEYPLFQKEGALFRADKKSVASLVSAGIDVVSLANNHFGDGGKTGMTYTMDVLRDAGVGFVGGGENAAAADKPFVFTKANTTFALFAFSDVTPVYAAASERPGYALIPALEKRKEMIENAKEYADVVIVSLHTGQEYTTKVSEKKKALFRSFIDAGATLVVGHHPHVVQHVEEYKDGLIYYSLGNFVFDQMEDQNTKEGMVAEVVFERGSLKEHKERMIDIDREFRPVWRSE